MRTNDSVEATTVRTPDDERLPAVHPERYGSLEASDGATILYDREEKGAWIRTDTAIELLR
jgi:hypothetical protein